MVRSKEVPKKPKDPLLTPPSKPRGFRDFDHGGSLSRNRGGAAMSPTPASVPNYMRATSSSDAKAGHRARLPPSSASPPRRRPVRVVTRGKVLFPKVTGLGRATCSSAMKEAKFPDALDLAAGATDAEGPAALRVCPYTYCSLNGHVHAPAVPLRSFLASRRRLIKTQQSMKLKGVSAFRKSSGHQRPEDKNGAGVGGDAKVAPLIDEEALGDFFVEVYAGPRVSSDMSCSDMSLDEMDATVRRMEFVVFDRCGAEEDNDKGNDLGVCGDGHREDEGRLEERLGVCRDSLSVCSDAAISGDFVEELPWMRYQGYEYDSLDDVVLEEHGVRDEIGGAEVSEVQEGKDEEGTSGRFGDECEEEAAEDQEAKDEESISVLARETEIVAEQDGADCRVESCEEWDRRDEGNNILDTVCQREASTQQETQEEKISVGVCKLEISAQEVAETVENILDEGYKEETSAEQEEKGDDTSMESASKSEVTKEPYAKDEENTPDDGSEVEVSETVSGVGCKEDFFEEVTSKAASKGEISDFSAIGSPDFEIQKQPIDGNVFEQDGNTVDDAFDQDESTADNAFEQDDNPADSHDDAQKELDIRMSKFEVACEETGAAQGTDQDDTVDGTKDAHEELEITTCNLEDASEDSAIAQENSQDGNSGCFNEGAQMVPEITTCKLEDASEESGTKDAHKELEITTCNLEDASEDSAIAQENSQDGNSGCFNEGAQMVPEITTCKLEDASEDSAIAQGTDQDDTVDGTKDAHEELEITTCNLEDASEDSAIAQENSQDGNSGCFNEGAQMVPEITTCKLEDASEESGTKDAHKELEITTCNLEDASEDSAIAQENSQDGNSGCFNEGAQMVPEITTCKLEDASEESDTTQETIYDDNSACLIDCAQMELGIGRSELEYASEEAGIAQEAGQDDKSSYVSDDAQNASGITMCKLEVASEEFVITQETDQDDNSADVSDGAQNESQYTTCESVDTSEKFDVTQEAIQDNTVDVNGVAQKELEIITSEDAHEESDITQGDEDDYTAGVNAGAQKELNITACESGGTSEELAMTQEADGYVNTTDLSDSDQKEFANACKEFCTTEETNLSSNVQIPEHTYDFSTIEEHGEEPQNLPAEDTDAKESSIDDICDAFSGMNLKGDVYLDPTETATCPRNRLIIARRRTPEEEEYMRGFNPRAPNFLPLELDPEAEKVDLKHQMMDERKNAEEWMIDYALRRAVNNLGPARKKKVELLVQAFETVLPHDEDDKKSITPTRPVQACN